MWNCTHFIRHPTDEQLRHVDIFLSDYYNLQSVYSDLPQDQIFVRIENVIVVCKEVKRKFIYLSLTYSKKSNGRRIDP